MLALHVLELLVVVRGSGATRGRRCCIPKPSAHDLPALARVAKEPGEADAVEPCDPLGGEACQAICRISVVRVQLRAAASRAPGMPRAFHRASQGHPVQRCIVSQSKPPPRELIHHLLETEEEVLATDHHGLLAGEDLRIKIRRGGSLPQRDCVGVSRAIEEHGREELRRLVGRLAKFRPPLRRVGRVGKLAQDVEGYAPRFRGLHLACRRERQ
mmetsp:Transcript_64121/g.209231  ORF Transcript_64121/g.209231 Transcript_64121/m.209231 type:complete len:214 (+) Transcript_64121:1386-2027(+)